MTGTINTLLGLGSSSTTLSVTITPASVFGSTHGGTAVTSPASAIVVAHGKAPYTYSWTCTGSVEVTTPTGASTTFSEALYSPGTDSQIATVTVTDSLGFMGTASIPVYFACIVINIGSF